MRPRPGDIYIATAPFSTMAGKTYEAGDRFELYEETEEAPFGYRSSVSNWYVKCRHFTPPEPQSVWSTIWLQIEYRFLVRAEEDNP